MKPPVRRRVAPLRLALDPKLWRRSRCIWVKKEKIRLLRALKAQAHYKELDMEMLKMELPKKTEGEIMHFIRGLKSRVAREAIRKQHRRYRAEKCWEEQILAPIEVWTELAKKVSDKLEEAVTSAFSQILTIAATEPTSLLHSIPTKPTNVPGKKPLLKPESPTSSTSWTPTELASPQSSTQSYTESPQSSSGDGVKSYEAEQTLDFENIYKYLFELSRGGQVPELSPFESAVLLDLLLSLPKELKQLDCLALRSHMYQSFRNLNMPCPQARGSLGGLTKNVNMPCPQARGSLGGLTKNVGLGLGSCKRVVEPPSKQREQTKEDSQKYSSSSETSRDERTSLVEEPTGLTKNVGLGLGSCKRVVEPPSKHREQTKEDSQKYSSSSETSRDERTSLVEEPTGLTKNVGLGLGSCKRVVEPPSKQREQAKEDSQKYSSSSETSRDERTSSVEEPTCHAPSTSHHQPPSSQLSETPTHSDKRPSQDSKAPWKGLGLCPLNVFMVPLKLLHLMGKDEA